MARGGGGGGAEGIGFAQGCGGARRGSKKGSGRFGVLATPAVGDITRVVVGIFCLNGGEGAILGLDILVSGD